MVSKILFLSHDADLQGAERCLLDLVTRLDHDRFEPLVLLPWRGPLQKHLQANDTPHIIRHIPRWIPSRHHVTWHYPFQWIKGLRARLWSLLHLIEAHQIDLIYTNTSTLIEGALAARRAGIPHIWHIHEHLLKNPDLRPFLPTAWIDRITLTLSDRILTPSKVLAEHRFSNSPKVHVVPNGIDLTTFTKGNGIGIRPELAIPENTPLITLIGAISCTKDPMTFARATVRIAEVRPDVHFLLAGVSADPELEAHLRVFIEDHGLGGRLHLLGFRRDVPDLLAATTVLVSTSVQETFGRTLIEAMAAGKPVVATRCGGPEEVVADGETGFVVPPKDPEATAAAVLKLLNDPALAFRMGAAGRRRVERHFTAETYARRIEAMIEEALAGR